jgi:hypothetical protein
MKVEIVIILAVLIFNSCTLQQRATYTDDDMILFIYHPECDRFDDSLFICYPENVNLSDSLLIYYPECPRFKLNTY